jgi:hypothetical protein
MNNFSATRKMLKRRKKTDSERNTIDGKRNVGIWKEI